MYSSLSMGLGLATAMASSAPKFEVYTTDTLPTPHHTTRHHGVVQEPVEGRESPLEVF
jgi:hypothetical protein